METRAAAKERPILFSGEMVRAILDGRKTQTRRAVKTQPSNGWSFETSSRSSVQLGRITSPHPKKDRFGAFIRREFDKDSGKYEGDIITCPYGQPGDRLWVREAHALLPRTAYRGSVGTGTIDQIEHPTDGYTAAVFREGFDRSGAPRWRPSIHMPRWASRILLEVVSVRVERLGEISDADAQAEGVRFKDFGTYTPNGTVSIDGGTTQHHWKPRQHPGYHVLDVNGPDQCHETARGAFAGLWTSINGADSWEENPWVWCVTFKRIDQQETTS